MIILTKKGIAITVIVLLVVVPLVYRCTTIPSHLEIAVKLSLDRWADQSDGTIESFSLKMSGPQAKVFENVSLKSPTRDGNVTTFWTLEIVMNDSGRVPITWSYEIIPSEKAAGTYAGTVIHSIEASGQFMLWIMLYGEMNGARKVADSESELVSIY